MIEQSSRRDRSAKLTVLPRSHSLGRRIFRMWLVWLLFGALVGAGSLGSLETIAVVSGAIAGMLVLSWFGPILALLGGQVQETLIGALFGVLVGSLAGLVSGHFIFMHLQLSLIIGGMIGANFSSAWPLLKRIWDKPALAAR